MSPFSAGGIYDGGGAPLSAGLPPYDGPGGIVTSRPICQLIFEADGDRDGGSAGIIWCLPVEPWTPASHAAELAHVVAALDAGEAVALLAANPADIDSSVGCILTLAGGGRA